MLDSGNGDLIAAIEATAAGFATASQGLVRIAAVLRGTQDPSATADDGAAYRVAYQLSRRLGIDNQEFLLLSAQSFAPGAEFTLAQLAEAADTTTGKARARLMNVGRSLKAIGGRNVLWRTRWDEKTGLTTYHWTAEGREAVLQVFA